MPTTTLHRPATRRRRLATSLAIIGVAATTTWLGTAAQAHAGAARTITVRPGTGTISAAVASAHPGDTLELSAGTFYDSVQIPISLRLRGAGSAHTVIRPPADSANACTLDGEDGLCVVGQRDAQGNPDRRRPVRDVTVSGLRVTGFSGSGVFGLNTDQLRVHDVRADHNGAYGIARFVSTRSTFEDDTASHNGEAGFYVGDSPGAHSVVRRNFADNNGFGVFLRDSTDVTAADNRVWGNCVGVFALDSGEGAPGDRPAGDYAIVHNAVWANDRACPAGEHLPFSGVGIGLLGVHDTRVRDNIVIDNHPTGPSAALGGIVLASTIRSGGADPRDNTVRKNVVFGNRPADLESDRTGTGNRIVRNSCLTTLPADLGGCTPIRPRG